MQPHPDPAVLLRIAVAQLKREHQLLTPSEVAERLQVSRRTVQRLVASGQLRPVYVGRLPRFTLKELDAFLAAAYRQR